MKHLLSSMRSYACILLLVLLLPMRGYTQPRYSPEVRAERETAWLRDSLRMSTAKLKKAHAISLTYNRKMDSVNDTQSKNKEKIKQALTKKKDADIKKLLTKVQYQRYCKRELLIRERDNVQYKSRHQPY